LPYTPPEFNSFKGPIIHSADWNPNIPLEGKIVGVIGSGASAIQIIPSIAPRVQKLHTYQRKPAWVISRPQFKFPQVVKSIFSRFPLFMWLYRTFIFLFNELKFFALPNSFSNQWGKYRFI
jgi:cation diffusion facilitator CzcD-associated flavoprotein CzcO